jgi:hypothetical protein
VPRKIRALILEIWSEEGLSVEEATKLAMLIEVRGAKR